MTVSLPSLSGARGAALIRADLLRARSLSVLRPVLADPIGATFLDLLEALATEESPAKIGSIYGKLFALLADEAERLNTAGQGEAAGVLQTQIERTDPLVAPLTQGQRVGTIKVTTAGGAAVASAPLVVQEPVELAGLFGRAWDAIRLWIK
mgnify:CR=1 FL=1